MLLLLDTAGCPVVSTARPWDRLLARLCAFRLDRALADGASPEASAELALRARLLARPRYRRDLACAVSRVLATARQAPAAGRRLPVPVCRDRVQGCADELTELIGRLQAAGPVPVRGIAKAGLLLADASGPLYRRASADDLRARVRDAADALARMG
jgi:hypothetical protein